MRFFEIGESVRPQKRSKKANIQTLTYYYNIYAYLIRKTGPDRKKLIKFSKSADKTTRYTLIFMPDEILLLTSVIKTMLHFRAENTLVSLYTGNIFLEIAAKM